MKDQVIAELRTRYEKYFALTTEAIAKAKVAPENLNLDDARSVCLDMVERYMNDSQHFLKEGKLLEALSAISYAHGWLDMGACIGLWDVHDSKLFTVDEP